MRFFVLAVVMVFSRPALADSIDAATGLQLTNIVTGVNGVTDLRFLPDGRLIFTEKSGAAKVRQDDGTLKVMRQFPVDTQSEKGLLGLEVDPQFTTTRRLFFYYSRTNANGGTDLNRHRVVSMALNTDDTLDEASEHVLVENLRGPANHDGGALAIGPDGKLYIGVGDTGCNCSCAPGQGTNTFGTCLTNGNGKILRVNLDGSIPDDNPLVNETMVTACGNNCTDAVSSTHLAAPRKDIWAWGFRNPWRISFDAQTGNLWVGDVGEITWEELNIVKKGKHYGWPHREGHEGKAPSSCTNVTAQSGDCVDPVWACNQSEGNCSSITGGVFVDSVRWPAQWRGHYFFADGATGYLSVLTVNATRDAPLGDNPRFVLGRITGGQVPVALRLGPGGDIYIAGYGTQGGRIIRLSPAEPLPDVDGGTGGVLPGESKPCGCTVTPLTWLALLGALFAARVWKRRAL